MHIKPAFPKTRFLPVCMAAVFLALVLTGCPGPDDETGAEFADSETLTYVTITPHGGGGGGGSGGGGSGGGGGGGSGNITGVGPYTGGITVLYSTSDSLTGTMAPGAVSLSGSPPPPPAYIVSITPDGASPILIGRTSGDPVTLNINNTGTLEFRSGSPTPIGSYAEFQLINTVPGATGGSYKQEADLNLASTEWTPIGDNSNRFTGIYDGNGKGIENLSINRPGIGDQGLFGMIDNGSVKNVSIRSDSVTGGVAVGSIAGNGRGTITGCSNAASVTGDRRVGGLLGGVGGTLTVCYNTATVTANSEVGGLIGNATSTSGSVTACYNTGPVSGTGNGKTGGLVGQNSANLSACYNTGVVSGSTAAGGLIGAFDSFMTYIYGSVTNCYWQVGTASAYKGTGGGNASWPYGYDNGGTGSFAGSALTPPPAPTLHAEWGIGSSNGTSGNYWKNYTGPAGYPQLWWE